MSRVEQGDQAHQVGSTPNHRGHEQYEEHEIKDSVPFVIFEVQITSYQLPANYIDSLSTWLRICTP
jgi:hypothetical protein